MARRRRAVVWLAMLSRRVGGAEPPARVGEGEREEKEDESDGGSG